MFRPRTFRTVVSDSGRDVSDKDVLHSNKHCKAGLMEGGGFSYAAVYVLHMILFIFAFIFFSLLLSSKSFELCILVLV